MDLPPGETMLKLFRILMPREDRFYTLFEQHANIVVSGAESLTRLLEGGPGIAAARREISAKEEAADAITHDVLLAVRKSFITPFDRSDIQALTGSLDDAIDQMKKTSKTITLFEVQTFRPAMQEMGGIILRAAEVTAKAMPLLRSMASNAGELHELTEQILQLEEEADNACDEGLKALYRDCQSRPMDYIVNAEVFDHLESVMDRFEDVANQISSILVEHL
jgi:predicted phosphate transport protein (TIGR00153 family)